MSVKDERVKLDEIDLRILAILQKKGRITNAKLASQVGLSAPPMLERVKKLERTGVIKGYRAILDAKRLGRSFFVFAALNVDVLELSNVETFERAMANMPEVLECHHIAGNIDFLLKINVFDQEHFKNFVTNHLAKITGIRQIRSWVVLSTVKESTELDIPEPNGAAEAVAD